MTSNSTRESPKIFLCYAREDFERVHDLYTLLKSLGLRPWLDKVNIQGGELWEVAIENAIATCDFFIATFSSLSVKDPASPNVNIDLRSTICREDRRTASFLFQ